MAPAPTAGRSGYRPDGPGPGRYHSLVDAILAVLRSIPKGRAASYGQVARLAGRPRAARQVARVLHSLSEKQGLPWHRVINRNGCISLPMEGPGALQARLLRKEGVKVDPGGKVDLAKHGWDAEPGPWLPDPPARNGRDRAGARRKPGKRPPD